jgi:hypothetical protein
MSEHPFTYRLGNCGATLGGPCLSRHAFLPDRSNGAEPMNEETSELRETSLPTADDVRTTSINCLAEPFPFTRSST